MPSDLDAIEDKIAFLDEKVEKIFETMNELCNMTKILESVISTHM